MSQSCVFCQLIIDSILVVPYDQSMIQIPKDPTFSVETSLQMTFEFFINFGVVPFLESTVGYGLVDDCLQTDLHSFFFFISASFFSTKNVCIFTLKFSFNI